MSYGNGADVLPVFQCLHEVINSESDGRCDKLCRTAVPGPGWHHRPGVPVRDASDAGYRPAMTATIPSRAMMSRGVSPSAVGVSRLAPAAIRRIAFHG